MEPWKFLSNWTSATPATWFLFLIPWNLYYRGYLKKNILMMIMMIIFLQHQIVVAVEGRYGSWCVWPLVYVWHGLTWISHHCGRHNRLETSDNVWWLVYCVCLWILICSMTGILLMAVIVTLTLLNAQKMSNMCFDFQVTQTGWEFVICS